MSLADILAKKKAAASGEVSIKTVEPSVGETPPVASVPVETKKEAATVNMMAAFEAPEIVNTKVAVTQVEKPMTFAEKMAQKKALANKQDSIPAPAPVVETVSIPVPAATTTPVVSQPVSEISATEATPEAEQAYADISQKIEALASLSDTPLENAMKDLKRALLANPNAVALMEDTDYGKMVIALRNLTKEAAVESLKEKVSGKKSKSKVSLAPEDIAAAFEEI